MTFAGLLSAWRNLVFSTKTCCRFVYNHPIILGAVLIFFILYRFVPSIMNYVFSLMISSAPILVCTLVLLQILFSFRGSPQIEEKGSHDTISSNARGIEDCPILEKDHNLSGVNKRKNINEKVDVVLGNKVSSSRERRVSFLSNNDDGLMRRSVTNEEQAKEALGSHQDVNALGAHQDVNDQSLKVQEKEIDEVKMETDNQYEEEHVQDNMVETLFDSDCAECSSTENADVLPILDEIDPLLDCKPSQPTLLDESDAASISSDRSIDGSVDSENREGASGVEDGTKVVVSWTEDDQKNLMDLGTSELERNQRLENLIARRRAKKIGKLVEKNLIDFDSNDIPSQIPAISTVKSNPFDLPFNSTEIEGLPPIPGSAPSILVPRKNPFDLPYDPLEERPDLTRDSFQQEYMSALQKDMFFCRHESFSWGNSFMGGMQQERQNTRMSPYFEGMGGYSRFLEELGGKIDSKLEAVPECDTPSSVISRDHCEKPESSHLDEELGEKSDSKQGAIPESSSSSPIADQECHKKPTEQESAERMISSSDHANEVNLPEAAQEERGGNDLNNNETEEQESNQGIISHSDHSDEVDLVESDQEQNTGGHLNNDASDAHLNNDVSEESRLPEAETSRDFMKPDVVEESYEGSNYSSSTDMDGESYQINHENTQSEDVDETKGDFSNESSSSMHPSLSVKISDSKSGAAEGVDDNQPTEPVYDSSPSAVEKRTIEESVFYVDKGILTSSSSLASDMHVEVSETSSPRHQLIERSLSYAEGEASFRSAVSPDDYIEDYESMSEKVGVSGYELNADFPNSTPMEPDSVVQKHNSNSVPSAATESIHESSTNEVSSSSVHAEMPAVVPQVDVEVVDAPPSHLSIQQEVTAAVPQVDVEVVDALPSHSSIYQEVAAVVPQVDVEVVDVLPSHSSAHQEVPPVVPQMYVEVVGVMPSSPSQNSNGKSTVQPSSDGDHHNKSQGSTSEANIVNNVNEEAVEDGERKDDMKPTENVEGEYDKSITSETLISPPETIDRTRSETEESSIQGQVSVPSHIQATASEQMHEEIEISMDAESRHDEQEPKETQADSVKIEHSDQDRDPTKGS